MTRSRPALFAVLVPKLGCRGGTLRAKVDFQIQIVPADGTNAAFNWRECGKPRWRLHNENYTDLQVAERDDDCGPMAEATAGDRDVHSLG
jgi:hypothetical protein